MGNGPSSSFQALSQGWGTETSSPRLSERNSDPALQQLHPKPAKVLQYLVAVGGHKGVRLGILHGRN